MSHQVLARQSRPQVFSDVVGQELTVSALTNTLNSGRMHHAYLFTGGRGVGKTTLARILAKCLNCEQGVTADPCGQCAACLDITAGSFVDLIEVDAASRTKVEDTRDILDNVQYAPTVGRYKVYLIDEVHMLSTHSFNALLKTLEEPPEHVKFLLATTDPQKIPATVLSRCLQFHLNNIDSIVISTHLKQVLTSHQIASDEQALALIAEAAEGGLRDALMLAEQISGVANGAVTLEATHRVLGTVCDTQMIALVDALLDQNATALMQVLANIASSTHQFDMVLKRVVTLLYQVSVYQVLPQAKQLTCDLDLLKSWAGKADVNQVHALYKIGTNGIRDLSHTPCVQIGFEMTLLRMLGFVSSKAVIGKREAVFSEKDYCLGKNNTHKYELNSVISQNIDHVVATEPSVSMHKESHANKKEVEPNHLLNNKKSCDVLPENPAAWRQVVETLEVKGLARQILFNSTLDSCDENMLSLVTLKQYAQIASDSIVSRIEHALSEHYTRPIKLRISAKCEAEVGHTPSQQLVERKQQHYKDVEQTVRKDSKVVDMQTDFNAKVKKIKPRVRNPNGS